MSGHRPITGRRADRRREVKARLRDAAADRYRARLYVLGALPLDVAIAQAYERKHGQ